MDNLNFLNRKKRGFIPFVTAAIMAISLFAAMPAMAQTYTIGPAGTIGLYTCPQLGLTAETLSAVIAYIREDAGGADCNIQFGSGGTNVLDIGTESISFSDGLTPWGAVYLMGRVTSSNTNVVINTTIASLTSVAYIENTGTGDVIRSTVAGTILINNGGEVKAASGRAIANSGSGRVEIMGSSTVITSANTSEGTIYLGNSSTATTDRLIINNGTATNTSTGNAIYNNSLGRVYITGGTVTNTSTGNAIYNNSTGEIEINGGTVTNTSTGNALYINSGGAILISSGTVNNTSTGNAIYKSSTGNVTINGGTVQANSGAAVWHSNTGTGYVAIGGSGTLVTSANTSATQGTIVLNNTGSTGTQLIIEGGTVNNTSTGNVIYTAAPQVSFNIASGDSYDFYGVIRGAGDVRKAGDGYLTIKNNNNNATGTFTLSGGTTTLEGDWGGNVILSLSSGARLNVVESGVTISGNVTLSSSTTFAPYQNLAIGGNLTMSGGTLAMQLSSSPQSRLTVTGNVITSGTTTINLTSVTPANQVLISAASGLGSTTPFALNVSGPSGTLTANGTQLMFSAPVTPPTLITAAGLTATAPVAGATPSTTITTGSTEFTAALAWDGSPATFGYSTAYTATITLTAASGYTFSGDYSNVSEIAGFTVNTTIAPTTWTSNNGTQLVFKVTFPATGVAPTLATLTVGLTPGNGQVTVAPQTAEAGYAFYYNSSSATVAAPAYGTAIGTITGATTYTLATDISGTNGTAIFVQVYKVETGGNTVVGFGEASATPTATPPTLVTAAGLTVTAPVAGATPSTTINGATSEFTAALAWDGSPATFGYSTAYTATVTLSAAAGYTFSGDYSNVSQIAGFTVNTIAPTTWTSNSGTQLVFKVTFPATGAAPTLANLTVGLTPGNGIVTVAPQTAEAGYAFYYNSSSATVVAPAYGSAIGTITGAAAYTLATDISGVNGTAIFVQVYKVETGGNTVVGFGEASATPTATPPTAVSWSNLTANGTSGTVTTTALTLTFDVNPSSLAIGDITVTGATAVALSGTGATRTLTISAITVANGANVTVAIANPSGFTITPSSRTVAVFVSSTTPPTPPTGTAPVITGPATMKLSEGYTATSTSAFTITGTSPVTVTMTKGDSHITWNSTAKTLDIAAGLTAGTYEVELTASNSAGTFRFTFTLTVVAEMFFLDFPTSFEGGTLEVETDIPYLAAEGETVTLIITPDPGYELESVTVSGYGNSSITIPVTCNGNTCTFTMPGHSVSISVTFTNTATGVDNITADGLKAYAANSVLHVSGLTVGNGWSVYNILGTLVYQGVASTDKAEIALPVRGVYIVVDGKTVVKVNN